MKCRIEKHRYWVATDAGIPVVDIDIKSCGPLSYLDISVWATPPVQADLIYMQGPSLDEPEEWEETLYVTTGPITMAVRGRDNIDEFFDQLEKMMTRPIIAEEHVEKEGEVELPIPENLS